MIDPKRGEIWTVYLEPIVGQEMHSHGANRPAIVVSSDALRSRDIRTIVPITRWQAKWWIDPLKIFLGANATNGLSKDSAADTTQARTVSVGRFERYIGDTTGDELDEIILGVGLVIEHP